MRHLLVILPGLLAACSSDPAPAQTAGAATDSCRQSADAARRKVEAAMDANRTCSADADCTFVGRATSCFDSCTGVVAKSGMPAVDQAKASAEATECKAFKAGGCKRVVPPCAPPLPPTCHEGRCG